MPLPHRSLSLRPFASSPWLARCVAAVVVQSMLVGCAQAGAVMVDDDLTAQSPAGVVLEDFHQDGGHRLR